MALCVRNEACTLDLSSTVGTWRTFGVRNSFLWTRTFCSDEAHPLGVWHQIIHPTDLHFIHSKAAGCEPHFTNMAQIYHNPENQKTCIVIISGVTLTAVVRHAIARPSELESLF